MAKILIVDDSIELTDFLSILLQLNDFVTETASTKAEIMTKLDTFNPDLVLLDIVFRRMDGRELCKEIKNDVRYKKIPIILISASAEYLKDFEDCNAVDVIEKPFTIETVVEKINKHLPL